MKTTHKIVFDSIEKYDGKEGVNLIVTSPPYPMVKMWDSLFNFVPYNEQVLDGMRVTQMDGADGAYWCMLEYLEKLFKKSVNMLTDGGIICINIGDAVRSLKPHFREKEFFRIFPSHADIAIMLRKLGLTQLPGIIWRKPTNAPNKFMGSGTLPVKVYVTLEHEHILIFRKGERKFSNKEKIRRAKSAFFYEERNKWFSDLWELVGALQSKNGIRTAAYPLEIPYRLINMYSIEGDTILDPFLGTGTTTLASILSGRNSIGFEINKKLASSIRNNLINLRGRSFSHALNRVTYHKSFIKARKKEIKNFHLSYGGVVTSYEERMCIPIVDRIESYKRKGDTFVINCKHKYFRG